MLSLVLALALQAEPVRRIVAADKTTSDSEAVAQPVDATVPLIVEPAEPTPAAEITVPKGHQIIISVEGRVGSKISTAKDFFPIKLAQSVVVDGVELLPAGITGEGQVVHAAKGGFGGSAGELILAARYLMYEDRKIPLRSFRFIEEGDEILFRGKDNTDTVAITNVLVGPLGFLIGGGNTVIEPGTIATAKFRADEVFEMHGVDAVEVEEMEQIGDPQ